jgi:hypothetical protein
MLKGYLSTTTVASTAFVLRNTEAHTNAGTPLI